MRNDLDDAGIRSYLLGLLPEAEAEALEDAYLGRPEVWERVRGVEDDLLDDYASGRLGAAEKGAFERRYLASPPLRERVMAARALQATAAAGRRAPALGAVTARRARWRGPLAIAAGVLIGIVGFWSWPPRPRHVTSASPDSISIAPSEAAPPVPSAGPPTSAAGPIPPATAPMPVARPLVLALSPVLLRGQARPSELQNPSGTDTVVLELEGDPAVLPPPPAALEVAIETVEGGPVWRGEARRAADVRRPSLRAAARVPAAALVPGDYLVTLSVKGIDGGTLYRYFFRVAP